MESDMMTEMFNVYEKAAIVSLLIEMANADKKISYEELVVGNDIHIRFNINKDTFETGRALEPQYAIHVIKSMNEEQKRAVAKLLVEVIDADEVIEKRELALLNHICNACGIDEATFS